MHIKSEENTELPITESMNNERTYSSMFSKKQTAGNQQVISKQSAINQQASSKQQAASSKQAANKPQASCKQVRKKPLAKRYVWASVVQW